MPESYPLPAYACSVWVAGDDLMVAFPGQGPEGRGHTIRLPASTGGLQVALTIMRERQSAPDLRLAQRGTPTQYDLETISRYMARTGHVEKQAASRAERDEASAFIKELGL